MKAMRIQSILVIIICGVVMILLGNIDFLPWWMFLLPMLILGHILTLLKLNLNAFMLGFSTGFLIWFGGNFLFDIKYSGFILTKLANFLFLPKMALLLISGVIGGVLTGLSMYVGKNILKDTNLSNPNI